MVRSVSLAAVACLLAARVCAAPIDLLGSASQHVRDAAAERLRETFVAPPRSRWEPVVASLNMGDSRDAVEQALKSSGATRGSSVAGGGATTIQYRLDDVWVLTASFGRSKELFRTGLIESINHVWVAPASDFTGVWTTYFVNGRRSREIQYKDGHYFGTFKAFRADGSLAVIQHYGPEGAEAAPEPQPEH